MKGQLENPLLGSPGCAHLLVDPDKWDSEGLLELTSSLPSAVRSLIVGGTYTHGERFQQTMEACAATGLPVGNFLSAGPLDAVLSPLASFVIVPIALGATSSRFLVDHLIMAAPTIRRLEMRVYPLAFLMLDGGAPTSAQFFTQVLPIPRGKPEIVGSLALVGRFLGVEGVYLEAGSGARAPIRPEEIAAAKTTSDLPVVVGGGVNSGAQYRELVDAGASAVIIGTAAERRRTIRWLETS